ncbi:hypothetical protein [Mycobacterium sp. UM_Kg1]|uniref:hypothetical protein n=1 Tax=Mycobacterium sp. UM_Kg1 TaxID=1545691 RepID=UPI00061AFEB8|nr:hypothetical protein [Mycobacterium sp. UM_Kg1]
MNVPDPAAEVDALIAEIAPGLRPPAVRRRDVVVVTGPWLAGVGAMTAALADRIPQWPVREAGDLGPGDVPLAVVFVVSAAAALTPSDCALFDAAAAHTDVVIGVVSKIDVHRQWPQMLAVAREMLAGHAARYRDVVWVGAAAAPERGTPRVDDVIAALAAALGSGDAHRRNRLRAWQCQLRADADRTDRDLRAEGRRARVQLLRERREQLVRRQRIAKAERVISLRSRLAQARVRLSQFADKRCAAVRGELTEDVTGMTRRRPAEFQTYVGDRLAEVAAEVDHAIGDQVAGIAGGLGLAEDSWPAGDRPPPAAGPGTPPLESRRLETQLMTVLGIGFGLGTALTLSRVLADLAPGLAAVGAAGCAVAGLAIAGWVVRIRGILRDRAVLERWVGEATGVLRRELRDLVALRLVAAEAALSAELALRNEADAGRVAGRVAELDRELREHAAAAARAAAVAERALPQLRRALERVGAELGESA